MTSGDVSLDGVLKACSLVYKYLNPVPGWLMSRRFKNIFGFPGKMKNGSYLLILSRLELRNDLYDLGGNKIGLPLKKNAYGFSIADVAHGAEVVSANYLNTEFCRVKAGTLSILLDEDAHKKQDVNYISLGWLSNNKSMEVVGNKTNCFLRYVLAEGNGSVYLAAKSRPDVPLPFDPGYDYGLILKISSHEIPERRWIGCMGMGESGTSGAAYYLANKWESISEKFWWWDRHFKKDNNFAALIKVKRGVDESACLDHLVTSDREVEELARKLCSANTSSLSMPSSGHYKEDG